MAILQRKIYQKIADERNKIIKSFISASAYSSQSGIEIDKIYGSSDRFTKDMLTQLLRQGIVKSANGVYWLDYGKHQEAENIMKRLKIIVAVGAILFIIATIVMTTFFY